MARRTRLDAELVRRGLARSRGHAAELIAAGRVRVAGQTATKAATAVASADPLVLSAADPEPGYASRGGYKLAGALDALDVAVAGRRCLDAGASTGGFTDVLLRRGAAAVLAVDVGYGQLDWRLRTDERVRVLDRTNVRNLTLDAVGEPVDLVVADLSFISLVLVLPALVALATPAADLMPMVKPQFEVGRGRVGAGGVVRDPDLRAQAVHRVAEAAADLGLGVAGLCASTLPGPAGNIEYFLHVRRGAPPLDTDRLRTAVGAG